VKLVIFWHIVLGLVVVYAFHDSYKLLDRPFASLTPRDIFGIVAMFAVGSWWLYTLVERIKEGREGGWD
jgi:hypothetical protein